MCRALATALRPFARNTVYTISSNAANNELVKFHVMEFRLKRKHFRTKKKGALS
jgi:hypothetical protein